MFRTTTVTELRSELASLLDSLPEGPVVVLSRSKPAAILMEPEMFDTLVERIEMLEDLLDGRRAIADYVNDGNLAVDAEEVFEGLGH